MYYGYNISDYTATLAARAEEDCREVFRKIDENALRCSAKVLSAFQECRVSTADFIEVTGYGYSDSGRDKIEQIYARVFGAEDALVRPQLMSGTHALAVTLGGLLKHGDIDSAVKYGNAMAALKNTIVGDMIVSDLGEVDRIIASHNSTGPKSEMIR